MGRAFLPADILLPRGVDMEKWAVIACDQHTGEPEYWERVTNAVGESPSALKLILPEAYLGKDDTKEISAIHSEMQRMLDSDSFDVYKNSLFYIERTQSDGAVRCGLVGSVDLEEYDYRKGSTSLIRATEATVAERLPSRVEIRSGAPLELPHVMILIDDAEKTVIEPCADFAAKEKPIYDFKLMENGGSIRGYALPVDIQERVFAALDRLGDKDGFNSRYGLENAPVLLFAMGDGNHSLAAAKEFYEKLKRESPEKDFSDHPARYALVELVNLHSPALEFEAIHRIIGNVDANALLAEMTDALELSTEPSSQGFIFVANGREQKYFIHKPLSELTVGSVQIFLDKYRETHDIETDYIHGDDVLRQLAAGERTAGFILPDMKKSELFPTVIKDGALPRKTFSMGHACDKRYYIEARAIRR